MKKFFTVIYLIAFCFIAVISMTNSAAAAGSNDFVKHSMAARQKQAAQRDRIVNQRRYALEKQARDWQKRRNPLDELFSHHKNKKFHGEPALNAPAFAVRVLELCNTERAKVGVAPLSLAADLQDSAAIRAVEITQLMSHTRPDGSRCFSVVKNKNNTLGENIAAGRGTPEGVVDQWMHSEGHRANILNPVFKELGVGYCCDENTEYEYYWVQIFRG